MPQGTIPALTGLRFVAALMVVIGHGHPVLRFEDDRYIGTLAGPFAATAMSLFFVLSGAVLWLNYGQNFQQEDFLATLRRFWVARFARLYPLLLVVAPIGIAISQPGHFVAALPGSLLYLGALQSWIPGTGSQPLTVSVENLGHTWSVGAEIFLYLCFPAIALGSQRLRSRRAMLLVLLVLLVTLGSMLAALTWDESVPRLLAPDLPSAQAQVWFSWYSPYIRLPEFMVGCVTAMLARHANAGPPTGWLNGLLAVSLGLFLQATCAPSLLGGWANEIALQRPVSTVASCGFIYALIVGGGKAAAFLSHRLMVAGGERSYSIYLLHPVLLSLFVRPPQAETTLLGVLQLMILLAMATATILVFASGCYAVIEVPARQWLRSRLNAPEGAHLALGMVGCVLTLLVAMWLYGADLAFPYRATRMTDLGRLRGALLAYRQDHGGYPPSPDWSGLYWPHTPGANWLPGLVPAYLASLPNDPRRTAIMEAQYIYKSDGRDYKLLAMLPEDCKLTVFLNPRLADPARNIDSACIAYGYWTAGAASW